MQEIETYIIGSVLAKRYKHRSVESADGMANSMLPQDGGQPIRCLQSHL